MSHMPDPSTKAQGNIILLLLFLLFPALISARSQDQTRCSDKVYKPLTTLMRGRNTFTFYICQKSLRPLLADVKIGFLCCFNALSLCRGLLQGWQHNPLEMVALPCGHSHPEMNSVNNCDVVMTSLVTQR